MPDDLTRFALMYDPFWCIEETAGRQMWMALRAMPQAIHIAAIQQQHAEAADIAPDARSGSGSGDDKPWQMVNNTALLTLSGPMTKQTSSLSAGTSTVRLRRMMRQAASDADVKSILLVVDSPGGSVSGTADLADDVARAAAKKPLIAFAEDWCASAAMWTASQATRVYANRTAMVGSIGTVMVIDDCSRWAANQGIDVLVFSTGQFKGAGVEGTTITNAQKEYFQSIVDGMNTHFLQAISTGRKMDMAKLKALADGRMYHAATAAGSGLIDGISTVDDVLEMLAKMETGAVSFGPSSVPDDDGGETDAASARESGNDKSRANSGEEKKPMRLKEAWNSFKATLAAAGTPVEADGPEGLEDTPPGSAAVSPTPSPDPNAAAKIAGLEAQIAAQQTAIEAVQKAAADEKAATQLAADEARVDAAVKSLRLVPSVTATFKQLAKENPAGFAIAIAGIEANEPIAALKGGLNAKDLVQANAAGGGGELAKLEALTKTYMEQHSGILYHEAFKIVSADNPDLATAYLAAAQGGVA